MENTKRRGMYEEEFDMLDDVSNQIQKQGIKARRIAAGNDAVQDVEMSAVEPEEPKDLVEAVVEYPESMEQSDMEPDADSEPELMMIDDDADFEVSSVKSFNSDKSKVQILDPVYTLGPQTSASSQLENVQSSEQNPQASTSSANQLNTGSGGRGPAMLESSKYMTRIRELHPKRVLNISPQLSPRSIGLHSNPLGKIRQMNGWANGARPGGVFYISPQMNGRALGLLPAINNDIPLKLNERAIGIRADPVLNILPQMNGLAIGGNIHPQSNGRAILPRPNPNNEIRPQMNSNAIGQQSDPVLNIHPQLNARPTAIQPENREIHSKNAVRTSKYNIHRRVEYLPQSTDDEDSDSDSDSDYDSDSDSDCSGRHNTGDDPEIGRVPQNDELLQLRRFTPPPYRNFEFDNGHNTARPNFGNSMETFLTIVSLLGFVGAAVFLVIFLKKILLKV